MANVAPGTNWKLIKMSMYSSVLLIALVGISSNRQVFADQTNVNPTDQAPIETTTPTLEILPSNMNKYFGFDSGNQGDSSRTISHGFANGTYNMQLTDENNSERGRARLTTVQMNFQYSFDIKGSVLIGSKTPGADGIAFDFNNNRDYLAGGNGNEMGLQGSTVGFGFKFDNYSNSDDDAGFSQHDPLNAPFGGFIYNNPTPDTTANPTARVGFIQNVTANPQFNDAAAPQLLGNIASDNNYHNFEISYTKGTTDDNSLLVVTVDNDGQPQTWSISIAHLKTLNPTLDFTKDFWFQIQAATGGFNDNHTVQISQLAIQNAAELHVNYVDENGTPITQAAADTTHQSQNKTPLQVNAPTMLGAQYDLKNNTDVQTNLNNLISNGWVLDKLVGDTLDKVEASTQTLTINYSDDYPLAATNTTGIYPPGNGIGIRDLGSQYQPGANYSNTSISADEYFGNSVNYVLKHGQKPGTPITKTIKRTINDIDAQTGAVLNSTPQTVTFTQYPILDAVTNQVVGYDTNGKGQINTTNSDDSWLGGGNFISQQPASFAGYNSQNEVVPAEKVTYNTQDSVVNVPYTHAIINGDPIYKTDYREINYLDAVTNNKIQPSTMQKVTLESFPLLDAVTGQVIGCDTNGDGNADTTDLAQSFMPIDGQNTFSALVAPDLSSQQYGTPSSNVPVMNVDGTTDPETDINIFYPHLDALGNVIQRTVTRTIRIMDAQHNLIKTITQTVAFKAYPVIDGVTQQILGYDTDGDGKVNVSNLAAAWVSDGNDVWPEYDLNLTEKPSIAKIPKQIVTGSMDNQYVNVILAAVKDTHHAIAAPSKPNEAGKDGALNAPVAPKAPNAPVQPIVPHNPTPKSAENKFPSKSNPHTNAIA